MMDAATLRRMGDDEFAALRERVGEETIRRNARLVEVRCDTNIRGGVSEWAIPMGGQVGLDTTSSASRQHRIDTGRYLRHGEAYEA